MPKCQFIRNLILSIFLIIDQLTPIILQIAMNYVIPPIIVDNLAATTTVIDKIKFIIIYLIIY